MSAPATSAPGRSPPGSTQPDSGSRKRTLDEDPVGSPVTSAVTEEPESKRRKTSRSPSVSPTVITNPTGAELEIPEAGTYGESSAKTLADDAHHPAVVLDDPGVMAPSRKNRSASGWGDGQESDSNTAKILNPLPAAKSGQNRPDVSNASATVAPTKSKKQLRREVLTLKNQEFKLPTSPTLLDPAFDGEMWESKAARFNFAVSGKNPTAVLSLNSLWLIYEKYLKVSAWFSEGKRQQKTQEARAAFEKLRDSGRLYQTIIYGKPTTTPRNKSTPS